MNLGLGFINNVAGTCLVGFLFSAQKAMVCAGGELLAAYGCEVGVVTNPLAQSFSWTNLMLADNIRAIGLRFGGYDNANNSMVWRNSWVSAVSRPNCTYCYGQNATDCTNIYAVRLLAVTKNTERLPLISGDGFQTICKA